MFGVHCCIQFSNQFMMVLNMLFRSKIKMCCRAETVKKLIELGEDVNQKSLGRAPIHYAARYNRAEVLKVLIENGADLKKRCDKGMTAIKYAKMSHADEALAVLEEAMKK